MDRAGVGHHGAGGQGEQARRQDHLGELAPERPQAGLQVALPEPVEPLQGGREPLGIVLPRSLLHRGGGLLDLPPGGAQDPPLAPGEPPGVLREEERIPPRPA